MNTVHKFSIAAVAALLFAAGCSSNPYTGEHRKTATGATIGGVGGAVVGAMAGNTETALIGAAIGATVGGLVGNQMDKQEAQLRQQMEGTGIEIERQGDTIRLQAPENITFDTNHADVKPQFRPILDQLATSINEYPNTVIWVEGHTDSTGAAAYNQTLSENRANSVRSYLLQHGVASNRVTAVGYGLTRPIADNNTAAGRAQNRRVEFLIVPIQQ